MNLRRPARTLRILGRRLLDATTTPQVLLERYEVGRLLGAGGMAEVFEGRDRLLARRVAIKVPLSQYAHDPEFAQRFRREAQAAASLSHRGGRRLRHRAEDGTHFIVMEYVDGRTLKDVIRAEAPLYPDRAAEITADVCSALAAAHARGLVHRDVKPANIMLMPDGRVKLMDLGIARAAAGETVTQTAAMLGTAQYLSPEQAQGQAVDYRSDLYSLGCCLYEMLTGTVPFRGRPWWPSPTGTSARTRRRPGCSTPTSRRPWRRSTSRRWPSGPRTATRPRPSSAPTWSGPGPAGRGRAGRRRGGHGGHGHHRPAAAGRLPGRRRDGGLRRTVAPSRPPATPSRRRAGGAGGCTCSCRWGCWPSGSGSRSGLAAGRRLPETCGPDPAHGHRAQVVPTTLLQTSTSQPPTTSQLPTTTAADHRPPTTQAAAGPGPGPGRDRPPGPGRPGPAGGGRARTSRSRSATPSRPAGSSSRTRRPAPPSAVLHRHHRRRGPLRRRRRLTGWRCGPGGVVRGHRVHRAAEALAAAGPGRCWPAATGPGWRPWPGGSRPGGGRGRHGPAGQRPRPRRPRRRAGQHRRPVPDSGASRRSGRPSTPARPTWTRPGSRSCAACSRSTAPGGRPLRPGPGLRLRLRPRQPGRRPRPGRRPATGPRSATS